MKCSACKIVAHQVCIDILMDRVQFTCKPTFRDVGVRQYREQTTTHHHWVHRRSEKGKCKACGKVSSFIHIIHTYSQWTPLYYVVISQDRFLCRKIHKCYFCIIISFCTGT